MCVLTSSPPSLPPSLPHHAFQVTLQVAMKDLDLSEREQKRLRCLVRRAFFPSLPPFLPPSLPLPFPLIPFSLPPSLPPLPQVGSRYNPGRDEITLVSNRFMNRNHNKQYLIYLLENLISEAQGKGSANASV